RADSLRNRRKRRDRGWGAVELASAMVRHHDRVRAELHSRSGIFDVEDALDDEFARPDFLDPLDVFPVQCRIELVIGPLGERCDILHAFNVAGKIAEGLALAFENAERPAGFCGDFDDISQTHFRGHRHAIADVAMTLAEHLKINGEDKRVTFGGGGAGQNVAREASIPDYIKLKPEWA